MNKEMMNTKEVAEYLGINEKHVYKLINDRKIPGTKITGKWLFPKGLIDEWINKSAKEFVGIERKKNELENHIVFMGSNDFTVDILSYELTRRFPISGQRLMFLTAGRC